MQLNSKVFPFSFLWLEDYLISKNLTYQYQKSYSNPIQLSFLTALYLSLLYLVFRSLLQMSLIYQAVQKSSLLSFQPLPFIYSVLLALFRKCLVALSVVRHWHNIVKSHKLLNYGHLYSLLMLYLVWNSQQASEFPEKFSGN